MTQQVTVIAIGIPADHLHDTLGDEPLRAVLWSAGLPHTGSGGLDLRRDVTALRSKFCQQEQPGIGGHQRLVETETQTSASGQLRINTLGDELVSGLVWHG